MLQANSLAEGKKAGMGEVDTAKAHLGRAAKANTDAGDEDAVNGEREDGKAEVGSKTSTARKTAGRKRKAEDGETSDAQPLRRSTRTRK